MFYTNGNYAAFSKPRKPANIEARKAYIIGGGLAGLSTAAFLIRDAQMPGENITILEELSLPGGGCDGIKDPKLGYIIRGGREMEDHFECLWDLYRSIPSLKNPGMSVLDEFYYLNVDDPSSSPVRVTEKQGKDAHTLHKFGLTDKAAMELAQLFMTPERELDDKRITDVFTKDFFESNFWLFWRTMFAFEDWHSAIEMRRYITRYIHHAHNITDICLFIFFHGVPENASILPFLGRIFRQKDLLPDQSFLAGVVMLHPVIIIEDFRTTQVSGSCNSASSCTTADYFCFQMIDCHLFLPSFLSVSLLKRENGCRRKCDPHNCVKAAGGRFSQAGGGMGWQYATSSFC